MKQVSTAEWEFSIVLPLGAIASQLQKIESQLRQLNMRAADLANEDSGRVMHSVVEGRLEQIGTTLDSVAALLADIQAEISPRGATLARLAVDDESHSPSLERHDSDRLRPLDWSRAERASQKRRPDSED